MNARVLLLLSLALAPVAESRPLSLTLGQNATLGKGVQVRLTSIESLGSPDEAGAEYRAALEITIGKTTDIVFLAPGDLRCVGNALLSAEALDARALKVDASTTSKKRTKVDWTKEFPLELCAVFVLPDERRIALRSRTRDGDLELEILAETGAPLGEAVKATLLEKAWTEMYLVDTYLLGMKEIAARKLLARIEKPAVTVKTIEGKESVHLLKLASVVLPDGRTLVYQGNLDMRLPYQPVETPTPASPVTVKPKAKQVSPSSVMMPTSQRFAVFQEGGNGTKQISIPLDFQSDPPSYTRQKSGGLFLEVRPATPRRVVDEVELRVKEGR